MTTKIIQNKNGNIIYEIINEDGTHFKSKGREKVSCKCGNDIDVYGAIHSKRNRCPINYYAVRCKRCGRLEELIRARIM